MKNRKKNILLVLLIVATLMFSNTIVFAGTTQIPMDTSDGVHVRVSGSNRYGTSYAVADHLHVLHGSFQNVVVAYGMNYPDALSGGYLSKIKNAPLLLVQNTEEPNLLNYISANMNRDGTIYILGGTGVVSSSFENAATARGYKVERLWGAGRYDTNLSILKEAFQNGDEVLVASGKGFADSLSGSAVPKPMLLVGDSLTPSQKEWLSSVNIKKFYILGGTGAVSAALEAEITKYAPVERIGGKNRWETSYFIAKRFFRESDTLQLATGKSFPDGLSGAPLALAHNAPIILVANDSFGYAQQYYENFSIKDTITVGGTAAISDATVQKIVSKKQELPTIDLSGVATSAGTITRDNTGSSGGSGGGSSSGSNYGIPPTVAGGSTYILNTNTGKYHTHQCQGVSRMADYNKAVVTTTLDLVLAEGYELCGYCEKK